MKRIAFALAGSALFACTPAATSDGGTDATTDTPLACEPDGGFPDASVIRETLDPTHPPHQNACNVQQIADYAQCQGRKTSSLCTQFKTGGASAACGACIETPHDGPDGGAGTWGVIVFSGGTAFLNVEGCVNDALGQSGDTSCGQDLHDLYRCEELACSACTGSDFDTCELESTGAPSFCQSYDLTVTSGTGSCSALLADTFPVDVANCFPDTSIPDSTEQQIDWLTRISAYMCGP